MNKKEKGGVLKEGKEKSQEKQGRLTFEEGKLEKKVNFK